MLKFCAHKNILHRCRMCKLIQLHHLIPHLIKDVIRHIVKFIPPEGRVFRMYYNLDHMEDVYGEASYLSLTESFDRNGEILFNLNSSYEEYVGFVYSLSMSYGNNKLDHYCKSEEFKRRFGLTDRSFVLDYNDPNTRADLDAIETNRKNFQDKFKMKNIKTSDVHYLRIGAPYQPSINFITPLPFEFALGVDVAYSLKHDFLEMFRIEREGDVTVYKLEPRKDRRFDFSRIAVVIDPTMIKPSLSLDVYLDGQWLTSTSATYTLNEILNLMAPRIGFLPNRGLTNNTANVMTNNYLVDPYA